MPKKEVVADLSYHTTTPARVTRVSIPTAGGNHISVFYNRENNLLVVDLEAKNETGGNEFVRKTLDEKAMLKHLKSKKVRKEISES